MTYTININDEDYEMKGYSFDIADKIADLKRNKYSTLRAKCKEHYAFICEVIGESIIKDNIGDFGSADPNDIELVFNEAVHVYNKPIEDYEAKKAERRLQSVEKLMPAFEKMLKAENLVNKK
jgi:hypothetical protein